MNAVATVTQNEFPVKYLVARFILTYFSQVCFFLRSLFHSFSKLHSYRFTTLCQFKCMLRFQKLFSTMQFMQDLLLYLPLFPLLYTINLIRVRISRFRSWIGCIGDDPGQSRFHGMAQNEVLFSQTSILSSTSCGRERHWREWRNGNGITSTQICHCQNCQVIRYLLWLY